jgi:hypothetical protein
MTFQVITDFEHQKRLGKLLNDYNLSVYLMEANYGTQREVLAYQVSHGA